MHNDLGLTRLNGGDHNQRQNERTAGSDQTKFDDLRRSLWTEKNAGHNSTWILEQMGNDKNHFWMKFESAGEYLNCDEDFYSSGDSTRRVFTWTDTSTNPDSDPNFWAQIADWEITKSVRGYLIKSVKYSEILFAAQIVL